MSSPFALFRKYQRVAMVIITGMAMISFVALGMVNSPQEIPGPLMAVFLAMVVGCGMWVAGLNNEKSAEWGVMGAILGALLGLYFSMRMQTAPVAQLSKGGNISQKQYEEMAMQRNTANQFMFDAMNRTEAGQFPGFSLLRDGDNRRDLIFCEILNREADRLKIAVPDKAVMAYLKEVTDKKLTYDVFEKIRQDMHSSDGLILDALRREIRAQQALRLLYPGQMLYGTSGSIISPEMRYEYFKKMNVRQSAELVALPVSEFEDGLPEPSDAELDELFQANRANFPNAEENGQPAEGRPGFRQPTRMRLAYVEASIPDFEGLVDEVTDEEIQQQYQENYKKPLPPSMQPGADGGPVLPPPPSSEPADGDSPPPPPKPESTAPATEGTTEGNAAEKTPAAETTPPTETPESEPAKEESETPAESTEEGEKTSSLPPSDLSLVAFFDDQPATEEKAEAAPAAEEPATKTEEPAGGEPKTEDAPEAKTDEAAKPEEKEGDAPTEPAKEEGTAEIAPPPTSAVRPLDDELKEEIRADIIRERAAAKSRETVQAARTHIEDLCRRHRVTDPDDEEHLTAEELSAAIAKYADEHHLIYVETPFLSPQELISSEDYPVGMAFSMENQFQAVAQVIARSFPDELYRAFGAQDFRSGSEYIIWKLDHRESGIPESLEDDLVRDQVVKAWKRLQALPKAEARGEELAKKIEGLGEGVDLAMVFAEETVTGEKGALYLTVKETGSFSWLQRPQAPQLGMQQRQPVRPSTVNGAEDAGERFMEAVCNEMKVGDVRVVPNSDGTKLYVVRIISRVPEQNEDGESFLRKQFLATGNIPEYLQLGQADLVQLEDVPQQWVEEIWDRYDVLMAQPEAADAEETDDDTADAS